MEHLQHFRPRNVISLPVAKDSGWQLKRYAILAADRDFDEDIVAAAFREATLKLPVPGSLTDGGGNHGIGFQIIHFAEVAVVSPVFYWQWGSVLSKMEQMRAQWDSPESFEPGVKEVVGCIWEMEVVSFEIRAWKETLLGEVGAPPERLAAYLERHLA